MMWKSPATRVLIVFPATSKICSCERGRVASIATASKPDPRAFSRSGSGVSGVKNAMAFPSGDQAYFCTPPGASIRGSASPRPGRKTNNSGLPRRVERKVTARPSGDQAGPMFMSGPLVTGKTFPLSTSASQTSEVKVLRAQSTDVTSKATILPDGDTATVPIDLSEIIASSVNGFLAACARPEAGTRSARPMVSPAAISAKRLI